jgi:hypothetical protein
MAEGTARAPGVAGYLAVFRTRADDLTDIGDDPSFAPPSPTWGICRPDVRSWVEPGQSLFFVAFHVPSKSYFARSLMVVVERISQTEAVRRYADRANLLLSANEEPLPGSKWWSAWRNEDLKGTPVPLFLASTVDASGRRWWHARNDEHEIDNWKCTRIFRCQRRTLDRCLRVGSCRKEGRVDDPYYASYVVGDPRRSYVSNSRITYGEVARRCGLSLPTPPRTARNAHPEVPLTAIQVRKLNCWFRRHGEPVERSSNDASERLE